MTDVTSASISGAVLGLVVALFLQQLGVVVLTDLLSTVLILGGSALAGGALLWLIGRSIRGW